MGRHNFLLDVRWRRAWLGSLFVCVSVGLSCGAQAQQGGTGEGAVSDAERIAKMRDLAASKQAEPSQPADASAVISPTAAQPGKGGAGVFPEAGSAEIAKDREASVQNLPPNESLPLGVSESGAALFGADAAGGASANAGSGKLGDGWVMSTLAALGVVIALVFGLRWLLRRGGVATASMPQGNIVEVLSRSTIAPRSHVVLMRVGQRILVVNDSPAGMRTLATIHDPEEVAEMLAMVDASKPTSMSKSFNGVMKKLSGQWTEDEASLDAPAVDSAVGDGVAMDRTRGAVSSVRGRLAALSGMGGGA